MSLSIISGLKRGLATFVLKIFIPLEILKKPFGLMLNLEILKLSQNGVIMPFFLLLIFEDLKL